MKKEKKVSLEIIENLIYALAIMIYFLLITVGIKFIDEPVLLKYIKISSMVFLILTIFIFEKAYKEDDGRETVFGIEFFILSLHAISLEYFVKITNTEMDKYISISAYLFVIYYVIKAMIIYTKFRKKQLDNLSDISEIVKENPTKKEPTKREKV